MITLSEVPNVLKDGIYLIFWSCISAEGRILDNGVATIKVEDDKGNDSIAEILQLHPALGYIIITGATKVKES